MIINKLVLKTGSACSLKCEKCGEFNPYLAKKGKSFCVNSSQLINDINKITESVEEISLVDVAGGEALLHQDLHILLDALTLNIKIKKIHLVTNGTIIPSERVLNVISSQRHKISVVMSDYTGAGVNQSDTLAAYDEHGISVEILKDMKWFDKSDTSYKNYTRDEIEYISTHCNTYKKTTYYTLIDGILSAHCPTAGSLMYYLGLYDDCQGEYIDIRKMEQITEYELKKLDEKKELHACNYCVPSYEAKECIAGLQILEQ